MLPNNMHFRSRAVPFPLPGLPVPRVVFIQCTRRFLKYSSGSGMLSQLSSKVKKMLACRVLGGLTAVHCIRRTPGPGKTGVIRRFDDSDNAKAQTALVGGLRWLMVVCCTVATGNFLSCTPAYPPPLWVVQPASTLFSANSPPSLLSPIPPRL